MDAASIGVYNRLRLDFLHLYTRAEQIFDRTRVLQLKVHVRLFPPETQP